MGGASKVVSVALRVWQLICSVIVLGILARFLHLLSQAGAERDGRVVYGIIVASISTLFVLIFIAPFMYSFLAFPFDLVMFVMWLVLFCLLITRTGVNTCSSPWYWNYWGYYWGGWWRRPFFLDGPGRIVSAGCGHWRTILAFSFMALIAFFVNAILGAYVVSKYWTKKRRDRQTGTAPTVGHPQASQIGTGPPGGVVNTTPGTPATAPDTHSGLTSHPAAHNV